LKKQPAPDRCRLLASPSSTTEVLSKRKTVVQRVLASSSSLVSYRSNIKEKNRRPTGVGFKFLSRQPPK
jgi:hypothetical protein